MRLAQGLTVLAGLAMLPFSAFADEPPPGAAGPMRSARVVVEREAVRYFNPNLVPDCWEQHGATLHRLVETVDDLASRVTPGQHVVCHADIHPGNLIADGDGPLHVVDWDAPILAPRERDLMFVYSVDFGDHPVNGRRAELFREGYGALEPDPVLLSYYRSERHLDDVAAFLGSILEPEASAESRAK